MNIYVGNLSYNVTEEDLKGIFEEYGEVTSTKIVMDNFTGRSKGFGFVEMPNNENANTAIAELNEAELDNRTMRVNEAKERTSAPRGPRQGGGGGGRGGDFRRNNNRY
jgi:RNA recognition motif-containing protein